ncbi:hypothetical protein [Marinobacter shengliensis]
MGVLFPAAQTAGGGIGGGQLAANLPPIQIVVPPTAPNQPTGDKDKKLTDGEKAPLWAACSLPAEDLEANLPPYYDRWVKDGKTKEAARTWLKFFVKQVTEEEAHCYAAGVYVSDDIVRDVKALDFARGGETTYHNCHRASHPFMCPELPEKHRQELELQMELKEKATNITTDDVRAMESKPSPLPVGFWGLVQQLSGYHAILMVLAGPACGHWAEVLAIVESLMANRTSFLQRITPHHSLHLLWKIHRDARQFFNAVAPLDRGDLPLPRSGLNVTNAMVRAGTILTQGVDVPEKEFLGTDGVKDVLTREESATPARADLFPAAMGHRGPWYNTEYIAKTKAVMSPVLQKYPNLTVTEMCKQVEGVSVKDVAVGRRGQTCSNFNLLGRCKDTRCNCNHTRASPGPKRITNVAAKLKIVSDKILAKGVKRKAKE